MPGMTCASAAILVSATRMPSIITSFIDQGCMNSAQRSSSPTQCGAGGRLTASSRASMQSRYTDGEITAQNATTTAVISRPCSHISCAPPMMVVLAARPTASSPISGIVLATINTTSAASVSASGRSSGSEGAVASVSPQRVQRAFAPGGSGGTCWSRSQPGQATVSILVLVPLAEC